MKPLSREDFFELPLAEIEARTGVEAPTGGDAEADYRERAWESYKQDVANREEWGGTEGASVPPEDLPEDDLPGDDHV